MKKLLIISLILAIVMPSLIAVDIAGETYSNRKETFETYDNIVKTTREKYGPSVYPGGKDYDAFQDNITQQLGTRSAAAEEYLISYTFRDDGIIIINYGGAQMAGYYTIDEENNIYIDNGASLLGIVSEDGLTIENKLIEGTLTKDLPIYGTYTNAGDMLVDYMTLFNEEMTNNNIEDYNDEIFMSWFMESYGTLDEFTEANCTTVTFFENGYAYVLRNGSYKFEQYEIDEENNNYVLVGGVPMFALYAGGWDIMSLFQGSILKRIELPEEIKKYE